jgi:mRNA interferase RelE/StbE
VSGGRRYTVLLTPRATRDLKAIRNPIAKKRIAEAIDGLESDPRPQGVEKLTDVAPPIYRIRVGDFRILYEINDQTVTVTVARIGDRKFIYKR